MTILIDGNNLIHKVAKFKTLFLKDKTAAQQSLSESLKSRLSVRVRAIIVFDGHGNFKDTNVFFSEKDSADNLIRKRIEKFGDYKKLKVVSSDLEIAGLAKACGCTVQKSEDFWTEINRSSITNITKEKNPEDIDNEKPDRINKNELKEFMDLFKGKNINQNFIYDKPDKLNSRGKDDYNKNLS